MTMYQDSNLTLSVVDGPIHLSECKSGECCESFALRKSMDEFKTFKDSLPTDSENFYTCSFWLDNFIIKETHLTKDGQFLALTGTCKKYDSDNKRCTAYQERPEPCRVYPENWSNNTCRKENCTYYTFPKEFDEVFIEPSYELQLNTETNYFESINIDYRESSEKLFSESVD